MASRLESSKAGRGRKSGPELAGRKVNKYRQTGKTSRQTDRSRQTGRQVKKQAGRYRQTGKQVHAGRQVGQGAS